MAAIECPDLVKHEKTLLGMAVIPPGLPPYEGETCDRMRRALEKLIKMIDLHRNIYGYEKQQYIIDEVPEWQEARAALDWEPVSWEYGGTVTPIPRD